ncbi:MAG: methionyl-tRNA formyltransferase [Candidatus Pacebacteria bacterium]|nr:methionyl-tRNA formyltransferase [Candidatus Paceibacterota bacterium]
MSQKPNYNLALMGTPEFSVPMFESLIKDNDFNIKAMISQKDKPVGRKQILTPPAVKALANKYKIEVKQPDKIKDIKEYLEDLNLDVIIVIAYGKILPQSILDIPKYGCINVHASLLPKYRGSSCLQAPILFGDKKTGLTIMKMDAGMDTGDIIKQFEIELDEKETLPSLHDKLSLLGKENISQTIKAYLKGEIKAIEQDDSQATYVKLLKKEDGLLDFTEPTENIERKIRALNPWPGTFAFLGDQNLKILESQGTIETDQPHTIGELFFNSNKLYIQAQDKALEISKIQLSGKKPIQGQQISAGYKYLDGKILTKVPSSSG